MQHGKRGRTFDILSGLHWCAVRRAPDRTDAILVKPAGEKPNETFILKTQGSIV